MSTPIFIDTGYILATLNNRDKYHELARVAASSILPPFITTEAVLVEIGNSLSKRQWRAIGVAALHNLRSASDVKIVPVNTELLGRAISFYSSRMDKEWGLTDCISFVVMQDYGIIQVLTTDQHFKQAGFKNLLMP